MWYKIDIASFYFLAYRLWAWDYSLFDAFRACFDFFWKPALATLQLHRNWGHQRHAHREKPARPRQMLCQRAAPTSSELSLHNNICLRFDWSVAWFPSFKSFLLEKTARTPQHGSYTGLLGHQGGKFSKHVISNLVIKAASPGNHFESVSASYELQNASKLAEMLWLDNPAKEPYPKHPKF